MLEPVNGSILAARESGSCITGHLDLSSIDLLFPLVLLSCRLEKDLNLKFAKIPQLTLDGSLVRSINAEGLRLEGDVSLENGFSADGEVRLLGATIGGSLNATGGTFKNPNGPAMNADRAKIGGSVFMKQGLIGESGMKNKFLAEGEVILLGATIEGNLEADGGTFKNGNGDALSADGIRVSGSVFLRNGFSAEGTVRLPGAKIGGNLDAYGGTFKNSNGYSLVAVGANVGGNVLMKPEFNADGSTKNKFIAEGEVRLTNAAIGGNLDASGGRFEKTSGNALNPDGSKNETALNADGIRVTGDIFLRNGFSARGEVRLLGATLGGDLDATSGKFIRLDERAPDVDGTKVNYEINAINADSIEVRGSVLLCDKFLAVGQVWLRGAEVRGQMEVDEAWMGALNLDSANIMGPFFWQNIRKNPPPEFPDKKLRSSLDLSNAKVGSLVDDVPSWPNQGLLRLDGFVYGRISDAPTDAKTRIGWLRLQSDRLGFRPQPYRQLAKVLGEAGDDSTQSGCWSKWRTHAAEAESSIGGRRVQISLGDRGLGLGY